MAVPGVHRTGFRAGMARGWASVGGVCLLAWLLGSLPGCDSEPAEVTLQPTPEAPVGLISIVSPYEGKVVVTGQLDVQLRVAEETDADAVKVWLDGTPVEGQFSFVPDAHELRATGLPNLPDTHRLEVTARVRGGSGEERAAVSFEGRPGGVLLREISQAEDRIGGPASQGQEGDWLLQNGRVQFVVQALGHPFFAVSAFGGNVIDADLVRPPWEQELDQLGAVAPGLNLENTSNPTLARVINDGADGGAVVLETDGPDDLLDTINVSSVATLMTPTKATSVPASADDQDLTVQLVNRYSLEPGADYLTWETVVRNTGPIGISFYYGDYVNVIGDVEMFSPGKGFGAVDIRRSCDLLAYLGHDLPADYAFGYIPEIYEKSSVLSLQGIVYPLLGQDASQVITGLSEPGYYLSPGSELTFRRWLVVGRDIGTVVDRRMELLQQRYGTVEGEVTQDGKPVRGARVAAVRFDQEDEPAVVSHWTTDEAGHWAGKLPPGSYTLLAGIAESANPGGGPDAPFASVKLKEAEHQQVSFDFPPSATLKVYVRDESGAPVPARVTLVGFDPSPDPADVNPTLVGKVKAVLFDPDRDPLPFGLVHVNWAGAQGETEPWPVEPGDYLLVVSRGPEYAVDSRFVTLLPGTDVVIQAQVARVMPTPDYASGDFHVHSLDSFDAAVTRRQRVLTLLAEGLDMFGATDHGIRVDYTSLVYDLGAQDLIAPFVSEEITTFDTGHYNLYPATAREGEMNLGATRWSRAVDAGKDFPAQGSYDLSPAELAQSALADPGLDVLQLNHLNSLLHGFFSLMGVDTATTPPVSRMPLDMFRQDPSITNLFNADWTAIELWRGYRDEGQLVFEENLGDYFNLLNQGIVRTMVANSDTHTSIENPPGGPRNFVALGDITGRNLAISGEAMAAAINAGRVICSNAPFLQVSLETAQGMASHNPGLPLLISATEGEALIRITVQSPSWASFDEIDVFLNTAPYPMPDDDDAPGSADYQGRDLTAIDVPRYEVRPDKKFVAGADFLISAVAPFPDLPEATRLETSLTIPLSGLTEDTWVVVLVRGSEGISPPLFPVLPSGLSEESNQSLQGLADGNLGEGGILALAIANPLFLDVNGNGVYDPPGVRLSEPPAEKRDPTQVRRAPQHLH